MSMVTSKKAGGTHHISKDPAPKRQGVSVEAINVLKVSAGVPHEMCGECEASMNFEDKTDMHENRRTCRGLSPFFRCVAAAI